MNAYVVLRSLLRTLKYFSVLIRFLQKKCDVTFGALNGLATDKLLNSK